MVILTITSERILDFYVQIAMHSNQRMLVRMLRNFQKRNVKRFNDVILIIDIMVIR